MNITEVKNLKGGDLVQDRDKEKYPAIGVIVDHRLCNKPNKKTILIQWVGGGSQISIPEYNGWERMVKLTTF